MFHWDSGDPNPPTCPDSTGPPVLGAFGRLRRGFLESSRWLASLRALALMTVWALMVASRQDLGGAAGRRGLRCFVRTFFATSGPWWDDVT